MPRIEFIVDSIVSYDTDQYGRVVLSPALPATGRLYVAWSKYHLKQAYVGTSGNVQQRFDHRVAALNEAGVVPTTLKDNFVYTVRIVLNGQPVTPDDTGKAGPMGSEIDVEHLLIRMYFKWYGIGLRNTQKWDKEFESTDTGGLYVTHTDPLKRVGGFKSLTGSYNTFAQLLPGAGKY